MKNSDAKADEGEETDIESGGTAAPEVRAASRRPHVERWLTTARAIGIIVVLWAFSYVPGLGTPELKGEEARRILPARTMLETGDYTLPYVGGKPYNRKPPLINWAIAGSFKVAGIQDEWAARAPSAIFVLVLGIGIACAGGHLTRSPVVGLLAAIFLLTSIALFEKGRLAEIEPLYVACTGLAFGTWSASWVRKGNPWVTWFVPGIFLGLGMLAKGPVHLLFYYAPICCCLGFSGRWKQLIGPAHLASLVPLFLPAFVWGSFVSRRVADVSAGSESAGSVWKDQFLGRLAPEGFSFIKWLFTPIEVLMDFLPWTLLLAVFVVRVIAARRSPEPARAFTDGRDPDRLRIWVRGTAWGTGVTALVIALLPQSEARYAHPALPAAALLLALAASRLDSTDETDLRVLYSWRVINRVLLWMSGAILLCLPPITLFAGNWTFDSAAWFALGCLDCVLLIALGIFLARRPRAVMQTIASACVGCVLAILYAVAILPAAKVEDDVRPVAQKIVSALPEAAQLCVLNPGIRSFIFYLPPGYSEVVRSSDIPEGTTHVLTPRRVFDSKSNVPSFQALGLKEILGFEDKRDDEFVLLEVGAAEPVQSPL